MTTARSVLGLLKKQTSDLHLLAEQHVRILDEDASVDDYRRYLRAMWGYHAPLEEMFAASAPLTGVGFEPAVRQRSMLLAQDLAALGELGPWPRCSALPAGPTLAHLLGIAYVLEGSTLGGRYILAKLPLQLVVLRDHATAFLAGYGADTGPRWRAFAAIAERELAPDAACDAAVAGARDTFSCLVTWLAAHEVKDDRRGLQHLKDAS